MSPERSPEVRDFLVPDLGEGLTDATIVTWLVGVGERVELNQPLCTVETAKAEVEVPSPHAGVIIALGGDEGETLGVGSLLARIDTAEEEPADRAVIDLSHPGGGPTLVGYGHDPGLDRSRRRAPRTTAAPAAPGADRAVSGAGGRPRAKPPVRLAARRLGVDLAALAPGSGPGGIITRADVEAAAEPAAGPVSHPAAGPAPGSTIPVRGVRARVAEHLRTSRARIPDATATVTVDATRLVEVRAVLDDHATRAGLDATVTPFSLLCRLVVQVLLANPILNATFVEDGPEIRVHGAVHLGIATATDRGLMVTVVRDAGTLTLHALSGQIARLAAGARAGDLGPGELAGSTFTISNYGALGLDEGVPIVNHPEAAILGVGAIRPRPHVVDGQVVARRTAKLTLAFDHRVCDGAEAGRFLSGLRELVETPELALLLS